MHADNVAMPIFTHAAAAAIDRYILLTKTTAANLQSNTLFIRGCLLTFGTVSE